MSTGGGFNLVAHHGQYANEDGKVIQDDLPSVHAANLRPSRHQPR